MKFSIFCCLLSALSVLSYPDRNFFSLGKSVADTSCVGKCTIGYVPSNPCQCNPLCASHNNCCDDYESVCKTCVDRCGLSADQSYECQCNAVCPNYNDCCPDFDEVCSGFTTTTKKPTVGVTDADLLEISNRIGALDFNNVGSEIVMDPQGKTSGCTSDVAPNPVFTSVNEANVLSKPTFAAFAALMDNYKPDVKIVEDRNVEEREEESIFLDIVMETEVMKAAYQFMTEKDLFVGDVAAFKNLLAELWFGLYDRDGTSKDVTGSSGFEHVFVGEFRDNGVLGFHNWYSFYLHEKKGEMNYYGYLDKTDFGTANGQGLSGVFTWNGMSKCIGSFTVGTSPEIEMALYTICFFARSEKKCTMALNNVPLVITTFPQVYKGETYVGTSYCDWK